MTEPERAPLAVQFAWYLLVGGSSTVVDLGGFLLLQHLEVPVWAASPTSFLAGTAWNYVLSYLLAFRRGRFGRGEEIGRLAIVVFVGLVLNSLAVAVFLRLGTTPFVAKTVAIPCVLAWNFLGRRWLVFHPELPGVTRSWMERLRRGR